MKYPVLALLCGVLTIPAAEINGLSGQWKLHSNIEGHESNLECTLTQAGQDLVGTCKSPQLDVKVTGKVEDKKLTFQYKADWEGQELTVIHTGTIETLTSLVGSVDVQPIGAAGEFTAIQSK
jgi:hypothetical protein